LAKYERDKKTNYDNLFLQKDVYDYKLEYELSIIGYYCNWNNYDLLKTSMNLLAFPTVEEYISKNVLSNYKFYSKQLVNGISSQNKKQQQIIKYLNENTKNMYKNNNIDETEFVSSTPALCYKITANELIVNTRFVNYRINEKGEYINKEYIKTINIITIYEITDNVKNIENIDANKTIIKKTDEFVMSYNKKYDNIYVGLEDVRMIQNKNKILYTANRGLKMGNMEVEYGIIDLNNYEKVQSTLMKIKNQNQIEKNWVLFENADEEIKIIYKWYPLTIGNIAEVIGKEVKTDELLSPISKMVITHELDTPVFFKWLRGSTNGVNIGDEIWFLTHLVSYEDRRFYYHCVVVLDSKTMKLKKYSDLFTFEKSPVEYTLGMVYMDESLLISYSIMDRETKYINVSLDAFDFTPL
jgi:hypothetical protein